MNIEKVEISTNCESIQNKTETKATTPPPKPPRHGIKISDILAPERKLIKFAFDKEGLLNEVESLEQEVEKAKNGSTCYYDRLFGLLHTIISKHVTINISLHMKDEHIEIMKSISSRILEEMVKSLHFSNSSLIYKKNKQHPVSTSALMDIVKRSVVSFADSDLLNRAELRANAWYKQMLNYKIPDFTAYLTYVNKILNEKMLADDIFNYTLYSDIKAFVDGLELNSNGHLPFKRTSSNDILNKSLFGVYNIDKAVQIIMKNRHILRTYFIDKNVQKENPLDDSDIHLIALFFSQYEVARKAISHAHSFIDVNSQYVDIDNLTSSSKKNEKRVVYFNPRSVNSNNCVSKDVLKQGMKHRAWSAECISYIQNRILKFKDLINKSYDPSQDASKLAENSRRVHLDANRFSMPIISRSTPHTQELNIVCNESMCNPRDANTSSSHRRSILYRISHSKPASRCTHAAGVVMGALGGFFLIRASFNEII
ncbi:hypothetical protein NEPAR07_0565 [Nematocida parisii]|nr:hypothetical protein NEPAR07_0565 [Nematocida parisii]